MDLNLEPTPENPARKRQIALIVSIVAVVALATSLFTKQWQRVAQDDRQIGMGLFSMEMCHDGTCRTMSNREFVNREINGTIEELERAIIEVGKLRGYASKVGALEQLHRDEGYYGPPPTFEQLLCSGDLDHVYRQMVDEDRILDPKSGEPMSSAQMCVVSRAGSRDLPEPKSSFGWLTGWITFVLVLLATLSLGAAVILVAQGKFYLGRFAPTSLALVFAFLALIVGCIFVASNPTRGENLDALFRFKYDVAFQLGVGWSFWVFGVGIVLAIAGSQMLAKFKPATLDHF